MEVVYDAKNKKKQLWFNRNINLKHYHLNERHSLREQMKIIDYKFRQRLNFDGILFFNLF